MMIDRKRPTNAKEAEQQLANRKIEGIQVAQKSESGGMSVRDSSMLSSPRRLKQKVHKTIIVAKPRLVTKLIPVPPKLTILSAE